MSILPLIAASLLTPQQLSDGELSGATGNVEIDSARVTGLKFVVTEKGRIEDCVVESSSGDAQLDAAACKIIMKRARYEAARDAAGKPIRAPGSFKVRWQLDASETKDLAPADAAVGQEGD